ncbi:MAG TPA: glycosyltransferase [Blastocatellia bacterium]|nr:glycosyltransferase [Blastocatellia bacterium]
MNSRIPQKQADEKVNIAFFENGISFGGAVTCLAMLIRGLDRNRFRAVVLSSHNDDSSRRMIEEAGGEFLFVRQYRRAKWIEALTRRLSGLKLLKYPLLAVILCYEMLVRAWYGWRASRVLARHQTHLVHLNNSTASNLEGILAAKLRRVKCVLHLRGYEYNSPEIRIAARWIDYFIAMSGSVADSLTGLGVPRARIQVIYDGIDFQECRSKSAEPLDAFEFGSFNIGVVGILIPWKGQRVFIEAANILVNEMKLRDCKFFLIGDVVPGGEAYRRELEKLAADAGLDGQIVFAGHQDNVFKFLNRLDVVVHTSILPEPFGRVIIEAMAMEKPVIATGMGGPLEIIEHGRDGILIRENDPRSLAQVIYDLHRNSAQRQQLAHEARRKVEARFSLNRFAEELERVYDSLNGMRPVKTAALGQVDQTRG